MKNVDCADIKDLYPYYDLLKRRGFLIELTDKGLSLSDNSHKNDWKYLDEILKEQKIGSCQSLDQIVINGTADFKALTSLFSSRKQGSVGVGANNRDHSWRRLRNRNHADKIPVSWLEPYIAYYIKALSACGIYTGGCCDGNHPKVTKMYIEFDGPVYRELHKCLWENQLSQKFNISWDKTFSKIDLRNDRHKQYEELFRAADYIYNHRIYYQNVRQRAAVWITRSVEKNSSHEELKNRFLEQLTKVLTELQAIQ